MRKTVYKKSMLLKTISLLLVLSFSFYNVSFSVTDESKAPKEPKKELTVEDIGISIDAGTVKSKYQGKTGKIIVHIQDAHCNYEAQNNINKILDQLSKEDNVRIVAVEGAEGIVDTTWFKAFPDAEIRREVADYFMKKGEITGAEFFSINSDYDGTIFGAEDREYYVKNLKAFTEVYPYKGVIEKYFLNLRTVSNRLKSTVYPAKLKELDLKIRAFDDKEIELSDFVSYLYKGALKYRIPIDDYPDFKKLVDTLEYEQKIDFDVVDQERNDYIDALSKKLTKEQMAELVGESIRFKKGHIKAVDFYSYLRRLAKEHNIPIVQKFPNLFYYYLYTKLYDTIDNEGLFKQIKIVQNQLKEKLFTNDTQRELDRYSTAINLYIDLVNIELTNDDYDLFQQQFKDFSLTDVVVFLDRLSGKYGLGYRIGEVPVQVSENLPNMVDFYEVAMKRDSVLIDNTLKQMKKENKDICVMIAGGFHTKGIKHILKEKDISYVVVTPKITKDVETPYIKVLTNQRTSLEDIITESAAMPGMGAVRGKGVAPKGGTLSPLLRTALGTMYLKDPAKLEELSMVVGQVKDGQSVQDLAKGFVGEVVRKQVTDWLGRVRFSLLEKYGPAGEIEWTEFVAQDEKWDLLLGVYIDLMHKAGSKAKVSDKALLELLNIVTVEFREAREAPEAAKAPPEEAARPDRYREIFGLVPPKDFGQELPLGRELVSPVPDTFLLNVSNVDKTFVVTGVDKFEGRNPGIILGLKPTVVKEHKGDVMRFYQQILKDYGEALNAFYNALGEEADEATMAEAVEELARGVRRIPDKVPALSRAHEAFKEARRKLFALYNIVEVTGPGQVISVPAGMVFTIPQGMAAVETYRPGEVIQSINLIPDRPGEYPLVETSPAGARFPQRIQKTLNAMNPQIVVTEKKLPEAEISEVGPVEIEVLPKELEQREVGIRVMTFNEDSELEVPAEKAAKARNYIVIGGEEAAIEIGGQSIRIPVSPKGTRAVTIPANIEKDFRIRAEKGTRIVEVSVPVRRETFEAALDFEVVPGTEGHRVARDVVFTSSEEPLIHDTYERTTIVKGAYGFSWDERHQVSIMVQRGSVDIVIEGENPIPLEAGEVFVPPQYSPKFEVVNRGAEAAIVKIDYKNTLAEDILFANTDAIRKHIQEIAALGKTNVVMLSETFAEGGANDPGSRDWWERMFHTYVNPNITIIPYWSESRKGVEVTGMDAAIAEMKKLDPSETNILIATESKIQNATDENRKIMKRFRTIGIPDLDMDEIDGEANPLKDGIRNMGWFFTREAIGAALLLSIVTPQGVFFDEGVDSTAYDMQRFMRVVLGREVSRGDICYMLPHEEVERAMPDATARWKQSGREVPEWFNKIKEDLKDLKAWFTSLLKKALLAMPIRAFDTNEDILRRHQNLFKAAKAV